MNYKGKLIVRILLRYLIEMEAVDGMRRRIFKSLEGLVKWTTKSLKNPTYQFVIGAVIVVYTAFLEKDAESVLSLAMRNPLGRLGVLAVLALLAVSSPALAILFSVLVVMSTVGKSTEGFWSSPYEGGCGEGFEDAKKEEDAKKDEDSKKDEDAKKDEGTKKDEDAKKDDTEQKTSALQNIASNLQSMMASATSSAKTTKEGFFVTHDLVGGYDKDKNRFHSL